MFPQNWNRLFFPNRWTKDLLSSDFEFPTAINHLVHWSKYWLSKKPINQTNARFYRKTVLQFSLIFLDRMLNTAICEKIIHKQWVVINTYTYADIYIHVQYTRTLPPERTQPKKLCTANFSSGTLKTLIDGPLWLKNKIFWRRPAEKKHFSSLPRARTPLSSG